MTGFFLPMIKLEDLWVGDDVRITSTRETGKFQKISNGHAVIILSQGGDKIVPAHDLELYIPTTIEPDPFPDLNPTPTKDSNKTNFHEFSSSIDLHIAALKPDLARAMPERIIMYQLEALENYLENAEAAGLKFFTIIHGKGKGVLKTETYHMLKGRESVKFTVEAHNGGAVEVWLR